MTQTSATLDAPPKPLHVAVLRDRYQSSFMSPRRSRHTVHSRLFAPFNKLSPNWDGFTVMAPGRPVNLVHAHNRIPFGVRKFIMSFESHLPRQFGLQDDRPLQQALLGRLLSSACRRIIGMSHFAARTFRCQHEGRSYEDDLTGKLMVRHPNVELGAVEDRLPVDPAGPLRLTFVGGHFGRKGGCVAARMAALAHKRGLPLEFTVISSLQVGGHIWTDPIQEGFFEPYFEDLKSPNVRRLSAAPNATVRDILAESHFSLLPTFADTFGYSAIESMAEHTPVIGSNVCALPEFITDNVNGMLLPLETTPLGEWVGQDYERRGETFYARRFAETVDYLAETALSRLEDVLNDRARLAAMRAHAYRAAVSMFAADAQAEAWDALYDRAAGERSSDPIDLDRRLDWSSPTAYRTEDRFQSAATS